MEPSAAYNLSDSTTSAELPDFICSSHAGVRLFCLGLDERP